MVHTGFSRWGETGRKRETTRTALLGDSAVKKKVWGEVQDQEENGKQKLDVKAKIKIEQTEKRGKGPHTATGVDLGLGDDNQVRKNCAHRKEDRSRKGVLPTPWKMRTMAGTHRVNGGENEGAQAWGRTMRVRKGPSQGEGKKKEERTQGAPDRKKCIIQSRTRS